MKNIPSRVKKDILPLLGDSNRLFLYSSRILCDRTIVDSSAAVEMGLAERKILLGMVDTMIDDRYAISFGFAFFKHC